MKYYALGVIGLALCAPHMAFAADSGAAKAFADVNQKMMDGMQMEGTGDADHDFAMMMIPHHQGAIDMAKVELKYGKDPEMRALAKKIMKAQKPEIDQMNKWLAIHPAK